jgi:crossover junction endodeoxyribonuclease RusA
MTNVSRETIRLVLPYPVSANRYWATTARGGRAITYVTKEATAYRSEVGWIAKQAGCRVTTHPIEIVSVTLVPPAVRLRRDKFMAMVEVKNSVALNLDNCLKVTLDALNGVVYEDDRQIRRLSNVEYGKPDGHGALIVEIREFVPKAPPLFADAVAA